MRSKIISIHPYYKEIKNAQFELNEIMTRNKNIWNRLELELSDILDPFDSITKLYQKTYNLTNAKTLITFLVNKGILSKELSLEMLKAYISLQKINNIISGKEESVDTEEHKNYKDDVQELLNKRFSNQWSRALFALDENMDYKYPKLLNSVKEALGIPKNMATDDRKIGLLFYHNVRLLSKLNVYLLNNLTNTDNHNIIYQRTRTKTELMSENITKANFEKNIIDKKIQDYFFNQNFSIRELNKLIGLYSREDIALNPSIEFAVSTKEFNFENFLPTFIGHLKTAIKNDRVYELFNFLRNTGILRKSFITTDNKNNTKQTPWLDLEGKIHRMQPTLHLFTVDEHSLQVVNALQFLFNLVKLSMGKNTNLFPEIHTKAELNAFLNGSVFPVTEQAVKYIKMPFRGYLENYLQLLKTKDMNRINEFTSDEESIYYLNRSINECQASIDNLLEACNLFKKMHPNIETLNFSQFIGTHLEQLTALFLSALLHDLGKGQNSKAHEIEGANIFKSMESNFELKEANQKLIHQSIKYHNILNYLKVSPAESPISELLSKLLYHPEYILFLTLADHMGGKIRFPEQRFIDKFNEQCSNLIKIKQKNEPLDADAKKISRQIFFTGRLLGNDGQKLVQKLVENFTKKMGIFYSISRAGRNQELFHDMMMVEETSKLDSSELILEISKEKHFEPNDFLTTINFNKLFPKKLLERLVSERFLAKTNGDYIYAHNFTERTNKNYHLLQSIFTKFIKYDTEWYFQFFINPSTQIIYELRKQGYVDEEWNAEQALHDVIKNKKTLTLHNGLKPILTQIKKILKTKLQSPTTKLTVYGHNSQGIISHLINYININGLQLNSMNFYVTEDNLIVSDFFLQTETETQRRSIKEFSQHVLQETKKIILKKDSLEKIFTLDQLTNIKPIQVTYATIEDKPIINIQLPLGSDAYPIAKIASILNKHDFNIFYIHHQTNTESAEWQFQIHYQNTNEESLSLNYINDKLTNAIKEIELI